MKQNVEILAPAGSFECLKAAVSAGADAVYIGGSRFGARAYADNLETGDMLEAIDYVHVHGRKIYMTVNTLLKDRELDELYDYLLPFYTQGLDAVIVQDTGVFSFVREAFPDLPIHVSTQMTVTGEGAARFFGNLGATRIVPARELSLPEIRQMKQASGLEIECFVHGALCYCYSGQCLLSSMIGGRSGNRGHCAQPCRLPYTFGNEKAKDLMSLKDLCTIDLIPELIEAGIDSFKIEGRMKQPEYVYTVTKMYRKYADLYLKHGRAGFAVSEEDRNALQSVYQRRGYTNGYYKQKNGKEMISLARPENLRDGASLFSFADVQEKINGKLILSEEKHAKLVLECREASVTCEGAVVETAKNAPLDAARLEKQMRKTGNTPFAFEQLDVELTGSVFLPMQAVNELRREGLQKLEEEMLRRYRREADAMSVRKTEQAQECSQTETFSALVQNKEQLCAVLAHPMISNIYVESDVGFDKDILELLRKKREDQSVFLAMPYIFRAAVQEQFESNYAAIVTNYDGVLIRNWESNVWLVEKGYSGRRISDANLYMFNHRSRRFLQDAGMERCTAPVELNARELKTLGVQGAILTVYGYQPVMVTANCIQQTTGGCTKREGIQYLTDRYRKKFAVKNLCKYCYNIIYNASPLMLGDCVEDIKALAPAELRLDFVTEDAGQVTEILSLYEEAFVRGKAIDISGLEYTRGHFRRGVK